MITPALQHAKDALQALDTEKILTAYHETFLFEDVPSSKRITERPTLRAYFQTLFALPDVAFTDVKPTSSPSLP